MDITMIRILFVYIHGLRIPMGISVVRVLFVYIHDVCVDMVDVSTVDGFLEIYGYLIYLALFKG